MATPRAHWLAERAACNTRRGKGQCGDDRHTLLALLLGLAASSAAISCSIARGDQRLNCSMCGAMAKSLAGHHMTFSASLRASACNSEGVRKATLLCWDGAGVQADQDGARDRFVPPGHRLRGQQQLRAPPTGTSTTTHAQNKSAGVFLHVLTSGTSCATRPQATAVASARDPPFPVPSRARRTPLRLAAIITQ